MHRHGAILLILRVRIGFNARRARLYGVVVQDREQVEVRENVEARETEEEDKTWKQQALKHVMTCG